MSQQRERADQSVLPPGGEPGWPTFVAALIAGVVLMAAACEWTALGDSDDAVWLSGGVLLLVGYVLGRRSETSRARRALVTAQGVITSAGVLAAVIAFHAPEGGHVKHVWPLSAIVAFVLLGAAVVLLRRGRRYHEANGSL